MLKKILSIALAAAMAVMATGCVKIVKTGEESKLTGEVAFNAGDSVEAIWASQAVPNLVEKAVGLSQFLTEAKGDLKSLAGKYGRYSMGSSGELSYTVKGAATVDQVVTDKKAGYMTLTLDGYTGSETIKLQIGTVYKGSAVRDSLDFIKYEDYKNQVEYAAVSQSIHDIIQKTVIDPLDVASLTGKKIEFTGCFTVNKNDELLITPVQLTVN